jgi:hypothetical protein
MPDVAIYNANHTNAWIHAAQYGGVIWVKRPEHPVDIVAFLRLAQALNKNLAVLTDTCNIIAIACKPGSY